MDVTKIAPRSRLLTALAALGLAACGPQTSAQVDGGTGEGPDARSNPNEFADAAPMEPCSKMDIVFVIDNSGSMREEQDNLIANFGSFATLINDYTTPTGDTLDYRLAVTTAGRDVSYSIVLPPPFPGSIPFTESGDNGHFRDGCGITRRWIERADPNAVDAFKCRANVGTGGPGAEMPLLGLEWSLNQRVQDGANAGFLRDDALLATVLITDQDDCSREDDGFIINGDHPTCYEPADPGIIPLGHYLDFLDNLKGGRGRWAAAVISGTGPGSCSSSFGEAAEAIRMNDFAAQVGATGRLSSICSGDLTTALSEALDTFVAACEAFPPVE